MVPVMHQVRGSKILLLSGVVTIFWEKSVFIRKLKNAKIGQSYQFLSTKLLITRARQSGRKSQFEMVKLWIFIWKIRQLIWACMRQVFSQKKALRATSLHMVRSAAHSKIIQLYFNYTSPMMVSFIILLGFCRNAVESTKNEPWVFFFKF